MFDSNATPLVARFALVQTGWVGARPAVVHGAPAKWSVGLVREQAAHGLGQAYRFALRVANHTAGHQTFAARVFPRNDRARPRAGQTAPVALANTLPGWATTLAPWADAMTLALLGFVLLLAVLSQPK